MNLRTTRIGATLLLSIASGSDRLAAQEGIKTPVSQHVVYRTVKVDGLSIFYREAGSKDAPKILLLHGLPSSSRMFEPLLLRLSDDFHLVAPDYPGFGHSDAPDPKTFAYTFDTIASVTRHFTEALGLSRLHAVHAGLRRTGGLPHGACSPGACRSADRPRRRHAQRRAGRELEAATRVLERSRRPREQPAGKPALARDHAYASRRNDPNVDRYDPDLWTDEFAFLNKPGQADIQSDLFYDYRTNVEAYPRWQAWMREKQPRLLVIWGRYDLSFLSLPPRPKLIAGTCRTPKFTFSTPGISRWTRRPTRSPHWCEASSALSKA
jgi:hypothetical protein